MKVLWAIEPFHQESNRNRTIYNLLTQLAEGPQNIDVGFVATPAEPELSLAFDVSEQSRFTAYPRKIINDTLRKSGIEIPARRIHIAQSASLSTTSAVDQLLKLASSRGAEIIGLFTHSRRGFNRLFLGSFVETAIHRSHVSLIVVNPVAKMSRDIKHVFFASDFAKESLAQLRKVLGICATLGAKLTVFHAAEPIYKWSLNELDPKVIRYRKTVDGMKELVLSECEKNNVTVDIVIKADLKPISQLALKAATKLDADLVTVSAKTGRFAALMGGSVTRQIIRESVKPVLVLK